MIQITDHASRALARLAQEFKDKPKLEGLLSAYLAEVQALEGALWGLLDAYSVDTAVGVQLDVLGAIVGQPREGTSDATYRLRIRARQRVNRSNGTPEDLWLVFHALEPLATVTYRPEYPAGLTIVLSDVVLTAAESVLYAGFLAAAAAAGVATRLHFRRASEAASFSFAGGPGLGFNAGALGGVTS